MKVVLAILAVLLIIPVIWLMKSLLVKKYVEWFKEGEGKDETKAMEMVLHVLGVGDDDLLAMLSFTAEIVQHVKTDDSFDLHSQRLLERFKWVKITLPTAKTRKDGLNEEQLFYLSENSMTRICGR